MVRRTTARVCIVVEDSFGRQVVALARTWVGTPYLHQGSCRGAGADCLGLVRGVWRELYGAEPESVPPYTADWSELGEEERLLLAAHRHLEPVPVHLVKPGDVLVLRMSDAGLAKHLGIRASDTFGSGTLIHAYSGRGVVESPFSKTWVRRVAGSFRFPRRL
jgi:NlpC/P60 family putative phage cell wall peptidase